MIGRGDMFYHSQYDHHARTNFALGEMVWLSTLLFKTKEMACQQATYSGRSYMKKLQLPYPFLRMLPCILYDCSRSPCELMPCYLCQEWRNLNDKCWWVLRGGVSFLWLLDDEGKFRNRIILWIEQDLDEQACKLCSLHSKCSFWLKPKYNWAASRSESKKKKKSVLILLIYN